MHIHKWTVQENFVVRSSSEVKIMNKISKSYHFENFLFVSEILSSQITRISHVSDLPDDVRLSRRDPQPWIRWGI
jgi:hypothetical protein